jgi:hypothetical protein
MQLTGRQCALEIQSDASSQHIDVQREHSALQCLNYRRSSNSHLTSGGHQRL